MEENVTRTLFDKEEIEKEEIELLLEEKRYREIKELFSEAQPQDIAYAIDGMSDKETVLVYRLLPKEMAAEVFVEMDTDQQEALIQSFSDAELGEIVNELYADDVVDIIEEMPANVVKRILRNADSETRRTINELLKYPEESAGSIMTTEYVRLESDFTVGEALTRIRRTGVDKETIYTCYVTDENKRLIGFVTAKALLLAETEDVIGDIMETNVIFVHANDDKENASNEMIKYGILALPVTDSEERLVGIITIDDAVDVLQEEATEDIEKMTAMLPSDKPYLKTGVWEIWKKRIPWLTLLMISATFTGQIITVFEKDLAALGVVALTAFIPMLMGTGGNAGGQSSVTVIRGLATGELELSDVMRIIWKETRVSVLCAITLAVVGFAKIILIDNLIFRNAVPLDAAAVVCIALAATVVVAKLVGCTLPLLAKVCRLDPAVMASPFITTIVDAISLLIYFRVALLILT